MLVVAIIGLLAAIAIPKFSALVTKAREAATHGKLGTYRSAISLYYADTEGGYPNNFAHSEMTCLLGKYIDEIPSIEIPKRHDGFASHTHAEHAPGGVSDFSQSYAPLFHPAVVAWVFDQNNGRLWVNCLHTDSRGTTWTQY